MLEDYADTLDDKGKKYLSRIQAGSEKMARLIEDLLKLSRITRQEMDRIETDLSSKALAVISELRETGLDRNVEVSIQPGIKAFADPLLIEVVLSNMLGNAWKFTSKTGRPVSSSEPPKKEERLFTTSKITVPVLIPLMLKRCFCPFIVSTPTRSLKEQVSVSLLLSGSFADMEAVSGLKDP